MTYPGLDTINTTTDMTQILIYTNTVTGGYMGPFILYGFWIVALIASYFAQMRFSGRPKFEVSFAVSSFISTGLALIMSQAVGLINYYHIFVMLGLAVAGFIVVLFEGED